MRLLWALLALVPIGVAQAQPVPTLRIGMQDEPDVLDPARGGTFAGRLVFASACDKLIDVDPKLAFVPQPATGWRWSEDALTLTLRLRAAVTFQDGTAMDFTPIRAQNLGIL